MVFECISFDGENGVNNLVYETKPNKKRQNAKKQPLAFEQTEEEKNRRKHKIIIE